jgi:hypothetical protein
METPLTRTLILEIALPDFNAEDLDPDSPEIREFYGTGDGQGAMTSEDVLGMVENESGLTTPRVNLALLVGSKDGNFLERVKGQIIGARIVPREPSHELADDDRLDDAEERDRA